MCGRVFLEVVSSLTEACKSRSLFLCSLHTLIGRSRVHNRTPVFSTGCLLRRVRRTDVLRSLVRFSCSGPRMAGSSWRPFPVYRKLTKVGLSFSIHCTLLLQYPQSNIHNQQCPQPNASVVEKQLPSSTRSDVQRSQIRLSCSEPRVVVSSWRLFPVRWKLAKVGISFSVHRILFLLGVAVSIGVLEK